MVALWLAIGCKILLGGFNTNLIKMENNTFISNQIKTPKVVGSYEITGTKVNTIEFAFTKKPKLINRLFCKWCLGWTWRDK